MQKLFTDANGKIIFDGAQVFFKGAFPDSMPVLDEDIYAQNGDKHSRFGIAIVEGDTMKFGTYIDGKLWATGLTWELDGEPCHDLINTTSRYRLEYHNALTERLVAAYEGDNLDALYAKSIHHLDKGCYGVEIDRANPNPEPEISATQKMIEALNEKHPNAIAIFGGALWVDGVEKLVKSLPHVISEVKFRGWHEGLAGACRTFCHLCLIDPMLVETYIGMKFEKLVEEINYAHI